MIKDAAERELLRRLSNWAPACSAAAQAIRPGILETVVAAELNMPPTSWCEWNAFDTIVAQVPAPALPHGEP